MRYFLILSVILLYFGVLSAQEKTDSIAQKYQLQQVSITATRMSWFPASDIQTFDAKEINMRSAENISELLSDYANVNIRSYGYTGLSNLSMRGAGSSHTALLWNGFNLQDPMNGGVNMLLFPTFFVDEIQVQKGGGSALFGSGAMGGIISLENKLQFNEGLQTGAYLSAGSFENYGGGISVRQSGEKALFLIKAFTHSGKNDFPFTNTEQFGHPEVRQENAAMTQWGVLQENAFLIKKQHRLQTHLWYQNTDRQLPPNMSQTSSSQEQLDESFRVSADWTSKLLSGRTVIRSGLFFNKLHYQNPDIDLDARHQSIQSISEAEMNWKLFKRRDLLNAGVNYTFEKSISDQYAGDVTRYRTALFASYRMKLYLFTLTLSGREEYVDTRFTPFTGSANLAVKLGKFHLYGQFANNYRIPTFNDLYWSDGMAKGNPDLLDESSWNLELAANYQLLKKNKSRLKINTTAFYSRFSNLIQWIPLQGIWMPVNQKEVLSRGVESRLSYDYTINKKWKFHSAVSYSWIRSTLEEKAPDEPDDVLHKQLIMTPEHQGSFNLRIYYGGWSIEYIQSIMGKQFTTADHSGRMDAYTLGNLIFSWQLKSKTYPASIRFRWNNIWNTVYQAMPSYAMPLANFELTAQFSFNHKKPDK